MTPQEIKDTITNKHYINENTYSIEINIDKLCEFLSELTK